MAEAEDEPVRKENKKLADELARMKAELDVSAVLDSERFVSKSPAQPWAVLLDQGCYLCRTQTMY